MDKRLRVAQENKIENLEKYIYSVQEWMSECEKKVNKQKCGKYIYRFYVKIWNDLNGRLRVV